MSDWTGEIIGFALLVAPIVVIWFAWSHIVGRKARGTDEEFEKQYAKRNQPATNCRNCGYDLRATPRRCPECGALHVDRGEYLRRLREEWPATPMAPQLPTAGEIAEFLFSTGDWDEADLFRRQLLARGIACYMKKSNIADAYAPTNRPVFHEILVYPDDVMAAKRYLDEVQSPSSAEPGEKC